MNIANPAPMQSEAVQPENAGRNPDGTFAKGNSANPADKPKGARHKATLAMEAMLDGEADAITRKAIELAKSGDLTALRLCMDRLLPPRRERPVSVEMPKVKVARDLIEATAALTHAVATGEITPARRPISRSWSRALRARLRSPTSPSASPSWKSSSQQAWMTFGSSPLHHTFIPERNKTVVW